MAFVDEFLEHYGTKGMKWGVRKNLKVRDNIYDRAAFLDRKDKPWVDKVEANPKTERMAKIAASKSKRELKQLKKEYKDAGHNVKKAGLQQTRYDAEVTAVLQKNLERASHRVHGRSPTGLLQVTVTRNPDGTINPMVDQHYSRATDRNFANIRKYDAKRRSRSYRNNLIRDIADVNFNPVSMLHPTATWSVQRRRDIAVASKLLSLSLEQSDADTNSLSHEEEYNFDDFVDFDGTLTIDDEGFYEDVLTPFDSLEQSDSNAEFLKHYGVPGMKWGVRKASKPRPAFMPPPKSGSAKPKWQSPPPKAAVAPTPSAGRKSKSSLLRSKKQPKVLSEEARQFQQIRLKAKKHGVQSLSNKDLELINKRLELQSKYNKAFPKKKSPVSIAADMAIETILSDAGAKKIVEFVGVKKPAQAQTVEGLLEAAKMARKASKAAKAASSAKSK